MANNVFANSDNMRDTLSRVGTIMSGKSGFPSANQVNLEVNRILSTPVTPQCNAVDIVSLTKTSVQSDRALEILAAEESASGNDDDFHCSVVPGEKFTVTSIYGSNYKVPSGVTKEEFIANCLTDNAPLENESSDSEENGPNGKFVNFSNSSPVTRMINTLRSNASKCITNKNKSVCQRQNPKDRKPSSKPTGYCLKYVKTAVVAGGFTSSYPPGNAAKDSGRQWKGMGFKNLLDDPAYKNMTPYTAPIGSIIVYSGGKYGHVEVKASEKEFISDYVGSKPIYDELGIARKVIGIYAK